MLHRTLKLPKTRSFFLFGARQVGKSTLLRELFSKNHSLFINLLDSEVYFKLLAKPHLLIEEINTLDKSISHLIIDEIQRVPELLNIVHKMIEERKDLSFILSGSSARKLKRQGANMLAGRALTYNLFPLTHLELAKDFKLSRALDLGTLPAVYLDKEDVFARETLKSYAKTYIEEEIKAEAQIRQLGAFIRFLDLAASENGSIINYSNIASDIYVDYKTVQEYYQVLEDTLIGFNLYGYAKSSRKQLSKHPKFYFFDTGVRRALAKKLDSPLIVKTREFGEAFEHFFIAEAMRLASYSRKDYKFSYYRTKSGAEVDLIIETYDDRCYAVEIKASDNVDINKLTGLKSFKDLREDAVLLCASLTKRRYGDDNVLVCPWQEVLKIVFG
ncbi:MAG: ATP-binding protein [Vampirovibrionia bacterium]